MEAYKQLKIEYSHQLIRKRLKHILAVTGRTTIFAAAFIIRIDRLLISMRNVRLLQIINKHSHKYVNQ